MFKRECPNGTLFLFISQIISALIIPFTKTVKSCIFAYMKNVLLVFLGGGTGSVIRYLISTINSSNPYNFPLSTFISNTVSSLVFGAGLVYIESKLGLNHPAKLLLLTGVCGGFSTYSTFTYENYGLLKTGNYQMLTVNIILNTLVCLLALLAGMELMKKLV